MNMGNKIFFFPTCYFQRRKRKKEKKEKSITLRHESREAIHFLLASFRNFRRDLQILDLSY